MPVRADYQARMPGASGITVATCPGTKNMPL
jgi:hypothetical protein